mmetsp:Transcript_8505/g.21842  ORF Transcript_8505/g.21842 Transcript_8505/m.21842 type:complete len:210 (+) Transcript_8505:401-1030(+)
MHPGGAVHICVRHLDQVAPDHAARPSRLWIWRRVGHRRHVHLARHLVPGQGAGARARHQPWGFTAGWRGQQLPLADLLDGEPHCPVDGCHHLRRVVCVWRGAGFARQSGRRQGQGQECRIQRDGGRGRGAGQHTGRVQIQAAVLAAVHLLPGDLRHRAAVQQQRLDLPADPRLHEARVPLEGQLHLCGAGVRRCRPRARRPGDALMRRI